MFISSIVRKETATQLSVDLTFRYGGKSFLTTTFAIKREKSSVSVVFGPSGAGKTTLLHALAGVLGPNRSDDLLQVSGTLYHGETAWWDTEKKIFLAPRERGVGLLFQDYSLFPHLTVAENIAYGLSRRENVKQEVDEWLRRFRLEGKEDFLPARLSGGEQQRVALAQTLAPKPSLVLLDEPFSALDRSTRREVLREVRNWLPNNGVSAIVVLHHLDDAVCLGDELIVMAQGKMVHVGKPETLVASTPGVAQILGFENLLPAYVVASEDSELLLEVTEFPQRSLSERVPTAETDRLLHAVGTGQSGDPYYVAICADDIVLESATLGKSSARNQLPGRIVEAIPLGHKYAVQIDCGFRLIAHITKKSFDLLDFAPGKPVTAVIKASALHLIAR